MFKVRWNEVPTEIKIVYSVRTLENGLMQFLMYDFGKWLWMPADGYSPLDYPVDYLNV